MQHPIGEHALLADSRTAALIDPDGNVAWLCWPRIDSTPLLFSILDTDRGGTFVVRPARPDARVVSRRYLPRSLVLETVWEAGGAQLIIEDALDLGEGPLLIRRLRTEGDDVDVAVTVIAPDWPGARGSLRTFGNVLELDGGAGVAIHAPSEWQPHPGGARSEFTVHPGSRAAVTLATAGVAPRAPSIATTLSAWHDAIPVFRNLSAQRHLDGLLETTAAVLLGLRHHDGGIVAAPTTSLPQWPGSRRTWDYRYSWLRDSSLAALAMLRLGLLDAASSLGAFIGSVVNESGPLPLVRIDGTAPPVETEIAELGGYRGSRPVRIGNGAAAQAQLDVPGEVIELAMSLDDNAALPPELATAVPVLADWLVHHWREPDNGIWEIRGAPRRYTHSLLTAISGLTGAASLVDRHRVAGDAPAWLQAAGAATAAIGETGGALQIHLDGGGADAALAQAALLSGLESFGARIDPTLDLIVERLDRGGLIDRHETQADTLGDPCAPFVFPTFWLAGALAASGRDGSRYLETALATRGPLGLFGEVADPDNHAPLGNYPQVQSHASFVLAVVPTERAF
jgi:GH15 family glucan-1,4-alpha-glucosidase